MPPSGYKPTEADSIVQFLGSVCVSLISEGIEKKLSPCEALEKECDNIFIIENSGCDTYQAGTLSLTREFYKQLLYLEPQTYSELKEQCKKQLETVKKNILRIHVPPI